jgi:hypothetical protein
MKGKKRKKKEKIRPSSRQSRNTIPKLQKAKVPPGAWKDAPGVLFET